jgi:RimJ/RimL family protein N-acetyltransferase
MSDLRPPEPPLADDAIVLRPLSGEYVPQFAELLEVDDVRANTRVPSNPPPGYETTWLSIHEAGWAEGNRAAFAIHDLDSEEFLGFAGFVQLHADDAEGEIGYVLAPAGRGRGAATRAVRLLVGWGFDELRLERIELVIADGNAASERVAERTGFVREGVLRSKHFKEGLRQDTGIWSRLPSDP